VRVYYQMVKKTRLGDKNLSRRFIETAREIGADDDEETFKRKLGAIAKAVRAKEPPKTPQK